jgi:hypothetical protein
VYIRRQVVWIREAHISRMVMVIGRIAGIVLGMIRVIALVEIRLAHVGVLREAAGRRRTCVVRRDAGTRRWRVVCAT